MQHILLTDPKDDPGLINGEIPYVAAGSSGQVLVSNGASVAPTFQTVGSMQLGVTTLTGSTDALPLMADCFVTTSGVDAMTLATPTAGTDDGKVLKVTDAGGHAHTITTAANKIVPSHDTLTFNGTAGSNVTLEAFNGLWYVRSSTGITATEV